MKIGDAAAVSRSYSAEDLAAYVELGGASSGATPEPLVAAMFSYLLGVKLPGPGTNYLKQSMDFHAHPEVGSQLTATVEITQLRPEKALIDLATTCVDEAGRLICTGRALVLFRD